MVAVGVRGRVCGQGAEDLPGEALVVRLGPLRGLDADGDGQAARRLPELRLEVAAVDGLVQPGCQPRGHRAQDGDVGTLGRDAERDVGLLGCRAVHRGPSEALSGVLTLAVPRSPDRKHATTPTGV
jgi:hypothetical protein